MSVVAITGGAQGIGQAIAERFGRAGYAVAIADTHAGAGSETAARLSAAGVRAAFTAVDVSDAGAVTGWIRETVARFACPDVLINNAGVSRNAPFTELPVEDFDRVLAVNLRGTFVCAQSVAREMIAVGRGGAIVNIASTRALMSESGTEAYSASKGGIVSLTHAMAVSLGPHGIRVNCISPGWIETRHRKHPAPALAAAHTERDRLQHPVGRVGTPEDIAEACLFLSASAGFMTGQNIVIDGGMTIKMIYED